MPISGQWSPSLLGRAACCQNNKKLHPGNVEICICRTSACFLAYSYAFVGMEGEEELPSYIFSGTVTLAGCVCGECPKLYWGTVERKIN